MRRTMLWMAVLVGLTFTGGCAEGFLPGVAVGAGSSVAITEGQQLAQKQKAALIAEILDLRGRIETAQPDEVEALRAKLVVLEKQKEYTEMTEVISNKVTEGLTRDWTTKEPEKQRENYEWIAGTAIAVLFGGWQTFKRKQQTDTTDKLRKAANRVAADADRETGRKISDAVNGT